MESSDGNFAKINIGSMIMEVSDFTCNSMDLTYYGTNNNYGGVFIIASAGSLSL
jgi:hypothetical protein